MPPTVANQTKIKPTTCSLVPFDESLLTQHFNPSSTEYLTIPQNHLLYSKILTYLPTYNSVKSFGYQIAFLNQPDEDKKDEYQKTEFFLGLGLFKCRLSPDHSESDPPLWVLHQFNSRPEAVAPDEDKIPVQCRNLVLFSESTDLLYQFCIDARRYSKLNLSDNNLIIYLFDSNRAQWKQLAIKTVRSLDSVILPKDLQEQLLNDIDDFLNPATAMWYKQYGIPHKRCYMFYGPPGTGKTSMVQVLAGRFNMNVCILQPSSPKMTDDLLAKSIVTAPKNSIIILEDIDALFGKDRKSLREKTPLSFTGLLNALDGVSNSDGRVFVMTSNHYERLDPALVRAGRVDMKIYFPSASEEQVKKMFLRFYEGKNEDAQRFVDKLKTRYKIKEDGNLSMASLQQHFIRYRRKEAEVTIRKIDKMFEETENEKRVVEEMKKREGDLRSSRDLNKSQETESNLQLYDK
eukprot:TRINITY_DN3884_c0_g1_i1.p1 TRINITY_DN3884_c0_g1~~TRINITY_DN3884_c0_g1_i1.p1  ORF type:complete len:478 (-),score=88.80 TRINITY_DN3884_c0_g1_i1:95-1477(-)